MLKVAVQVENLKEKTTPPGKYDQENGSECCKQGKLYTTYKCSPPVTKNTKATLTLNSFEKGKDCSGLSECDRQYHDDDRLNNLL
ncbi:hypothetical protein AG4045_001733 [Apium graveolens]|uniref:Uncharacterized protein n=1 Tax=Apium graveolens TaxID=4045 RepID=A0A6L5BAQ4_APIGR|nr:hypothetical protein AG4045_001733 [Apium graveolens]